MSKKFIAAGFTAAFFSLASTAAMASAFQLWEQNGAGVGDYHAGSAAEANDASTGYYNPAGLVRIKNPQLVVGAVSIITDFKFKGMGENLLVLHEGGNEQAISFGKQTGTAQGGGFNFVPDLHFAMPLAKVDPSLYFGFDITVPFGLETNWPTTSPMRFEATTSQIQTVDVSPSLAYQLTRKLSFGAGVDYQYLHGEFDQVVDPIVPIRRLYLSENGGQDWAWGWHAGLLMQFTPESRLGFNYRSSIHHQLQGTSTMTNIATNALVNSSGDLSANVTLPATSTLSYYQGFENDRWALMGTVDYTQWDVLPSLTLKNVASPWNEPLVKTMNSGLVFNYKNTWNFALGMHYRFNQKWMLRFGGGYDQTPTSDKYRDIRLPDQNRKALSIGGQYKWSKNITTDFGWTHFFVGTANVNKRVELIEARLAKIKVEGDNYAVTQGAVNFSADVLGLQLTWNMT